jgi:hypothetical protein
MFLELNTATNVPVCRHSNPEIELEIAEVGVLAGRLY